MKLHARLETADLLVVTVQEDRIDAGNAREFRDAMSTHLREQARVVLDLEQVSFIDSAGVCALLDGLRQASRQRGDVKLCHLKREVLAVLELLRMRSIFNVHDTREQAVAAFAAPAPQRPEASPGTPGPAAASQPNGWPGTWLRRLAA